MNVPALEKTEEFNRMFGPFWGHSKEERAFYEGVRYGLAKSKKFLKIIIFSKESLEAPSLHISQLRELHDEINDLMALIKKQMSE